MAHKNVRKLKGIGHLCLCLTSNNFYLEHTISHSALFFRLEVRRSDFGGWKKSVRVTALFRGCADSWRLGDERILVGS